MAENRNQKSKVVGRGLGEHGHRRSSEARKMNSLNDPGRPVRRMEPVQNLKHGGPRGLGWLTVGD